MTDSSNHVSYSRYGVPQTCHGCGRKLAAVTKEPALWFTSLPKKAVYGYCCWKKGAKP